MEGFGFRLLGVGPGYLGIRVYGMISSIETIGLRVEGQAKVCRVQVRGSSRILAMPRGLCGQSPTLSPKL